MKRIQVSFIEIVFDIFEELVFGCDLVVSFNMVDHLDKVVWNALEIDLARDWCPAEVEMTHLCVLELDPKVGPGFLHDSFDESSVVATEDLVLKLATSLGFWWLKVEVRWDVLVQHLGSFA